MTENVKTPWWQYLGRTNERPTFLGTAIGAVENAEMLEVDPDKETDEGTEGG